MYVYICKMVDSIDVFSWYIGPQNASGWPGFGQVGQQNFDAILDSGSFELVIFTRDCHLWQRVISKQDAFKFVKKIPYETLLNHVKPWFFGEFSDILRGLD